MLNKNKNLLIILIVWGGVWFLPSMMGDDFLSNYCTQSPKYDYLQLKKTVQTSSLSAVTSFLAKRYKVSYSNIEYLLKDPSGKSDIFNAFIEVSTILTFLQSLDLSSTIDPIRVKRKNSIVDFYVDDIPIDVKAPPLFDMWTTSQKGYQALLKSLYKKSFQMTYDVKTNQIIPIRLLINLSFLPTEDRTKIVADIKHRLGIYPVIFICF